MAGDRFMFVTHSDDNRGLVIKADDQKNKKSNGTGVVQGNIQFDSPIHGIGVVPIGAVIAFGGTNTSGTPGWLICDGRKLNTGSYPQLFKAIGYAHGGSGANFYLPDLRGRVVAGYSTSSSLTSTLSNCNKMGNKQGAKTHKLSIAQMPSHNHRISGCDGGSGQKAAVDIDWDDDEGKYAVSSSIKNTGGDQAHNNVQPTIVLHYFIRAL